MTKSNNHVVKVRMSGGCMLAFALYSAALIALGTQCKSCGRDAGTPEKTTKTEQHQARPDSLYIQKTR